MNTYLRKALESELVITKLGTVNDYLPFDARLLNYLATDTEGPDGWKYSKLQELRRFQEKRGLTSTWKMWRFVKLSVESLLLRK